MNTSEIKKNDMVKDVYGDWHRVFEVRDNIIYTFDQKHVHITKVIKIQRMSIPESE